MPTPYNKDFTRRKSSYLHDADCRTTGSLRLPAGGLGEAFTYFGEVTLNEAIEAGECISMVRVHKGFKVTGVTLVWAGPEGVAPAGDVVIGFGDPFACGRLSNAPIDMRWLSDRGQNNSGSFASCGVLTKVGRVGDGCGIGYVYTCDTDLIVSNLYGLGSHQQGGWEGGGQISGGGVWGGAITSGTTIAVEVRGIQTTGSGG